jgi:N-acetylneuraminic acid mutarotase
MKPLFLLFTAVLSAHAHFLFVVPSSDGARASLFLSEDLKPEKGVPPAMVAPARLQLRHQGQDHALTVEKLGEAYQVVLPGQGARVIHGLLDLGFTRGGNYLLHYHPKTILGTPFAVAVGAAPVEIVPHGKPGAVTLQVLAHGKPLPNAEINLVLPDGTAKKLKTGADGSSEALALPGRYGAWARFWEPAEGVRDGKPYEQLRHYATLVFDAPYPPMPEATSSFGSVVSDGWLYVYGGHIAKTHSYSKDAVSGQFHRLHLTGTPVWEKLPAGPPLQGMNLAAYAGKIYRIGGMAPRNEPTAPADIHSTADCARFDPATGRWESLPPLPQPRSSHDVVVLGDQLIVAGGWNLRGKEPSEWADTILTLDLKAPQPAWVAAPQPFRRRALMAVAHHGKMYVIGGFDEKNAIHRSVSVYDPATKTWNEAAKLPAGKGLGFAPAATAHRGKVFVSVSDGTLLQLDETTGEWAKVGLSTPRLAHRLAAHGESILALGGADSGKNFDLIDAIELR